MSGLDGILRIASIYHDRCLATLVKTAVIKQLPSGKFRVLSEKGRNLGTYSSRKKAEKRLKQVEYFKYLDESSAKDSKNVIDLTKLEELSFSALMRKLRANASKEQVRDFLKIHKFYFDKAVKNKLKDPQDTAFQHAFLKFTKKHKVNLNKTLVKQAARHGSRAELGEPVAVGKYLADIIRLTLRRISPFSRNKAVSKLKGKLYYLKETDLALKKMPASSAMGQSITFVKNLLFGQDPIYIRKVLNSLVKYL